MADGNFTAAHQKQPRPEDDVWLKDGESYMTQRRPYLNHIKEAIEDHDVCDKLDLLRIEWEVKKLLAKNLS